MTSYRIITAKQGGNMPKFKLEADVDDLVKEVFTQLGLKKHIDFSEKSSMSDYLKEALKGAAKTKEKTHFGEPDFHIEKYHIPVIIENKLGLKWHIAEDKSGLKQDEKSVQKYAVNGAIYYARNMIASRKYDEVIAIGISGDDRDNIKIFVYYVFSATIPPKFISSYQSLDFLQNKNSFAAFYKEVTVTEEEKHQILIRTRDEIFKHSTKLSKLMNNHNISTEQRVVYVSGMLLSMQDVFDTKGNIVDEGLTPDDLKGIQTEQKRDGVVIIKHLEEFLDQKKIPLDKKKIMIDSFKMSISLDADRDKITEPDKAVSKILKSPASVTKQIFTYLYENIFKAIDLSHGALDIMAEMYSTFLKYALSDGASLGKVLTPPYITTLMSKVLDVNKDSRVMDLATGSAAFLVASMTSMIEDANKAYGKNTDKALEKIEKIKTEQLLGIEVDVKMYTLATSNMILRGDGSSQIKKADTFKTPYEMFAEFQADTLLLNPPFSHEENGMPFFAFGLDRMKKGGKGAIIIQDSAGSGIAMSTNKKILAKHKMLASIKMPTDLFQPNAGVQTSIYIFEAGTPHDFKHDIVKFIDFRNDGYKRTARGVYETNNPAERYNDLYLIYKMGRNVKANPEFHSDLWDLDRIFLEDTISASGCDWNFEQHQVINTIPSEEDFIKVVGAYISWEANRLLENKKYGHAIPHDLEKVALTTDDMKTENIHRGSQFRDFPLRELFYIYTGSDFIMMNAESGKIPVISRSSSNNGLGIYSNVVPNQKLFNHKITITATLIGKIWSTIHSEDFYLGTRVKGLVSKDVSLDKAALQYMTVSLNKIGETYVTYQNKPAEFESLSIRLPVTDDDKPDYLLMSKYMNMIKKKFVNSIKKEMDERLTLLAQLASQQ